MNVRHIAYPFSEGPAPFSATPPHPGRAPIIFCTPRQPKKHGHLRIGDWLHRRTKPICHDRLSSRNTAIPMLSLLCDTFLTAFWIKKSAHDKTGVEKNSTNGKTMALQIRQNRPSQHQTDAQCAVARPQLITSGIIPAKAESCAYNNQMLIV